MKRFLPLLLVLSAGCSYYTERFSFTNFKPKPALARSPGADVTELIDETSFLTNGSPTNLPIAYSVRVFNVTFLQWGKAARLQTQTRTRDFSRYVNGEGLEFGVETEALKAITEGITEGIVKGVKGGVP